ncbi:hypothetical protein [Cupriavidus pinatubonensis]|uniref:hypothetical protein n=1 Tax=Cupriavidus pinatubonensis TaxID=248026 RepID=UPI003614B240
MKRTALLVTALLVSCPTWGQSVQEIIDALNAAARAEEARVNAQLEADARARQEKYDNEMVWVCKCVAGSPVFYSTTRKQYEAEIKAKQERSQTLYQLYPNMSLQANMTLANPCNKL